MYRAAYPSHWILTQVMNHDNLASMPLPPSMPNARSHASFAFPGFYPGCMEVVPLLSLDPTSVPSLQRDILGLEKPFWNKRDSVFESSRGSRNFVHSDNVRNRHKLSCQNSWMGESSQITARTCNDPRKVVDDKNVNPKMSHDSCHLQVQALDFCSQVLNNKGVKRPLDAIQPRSREQSPQSDNEVLYVCTKRRPPQDLNNSLVSKTDVKEAFIPTIKYPKLLLKNEEWADLSIEMWDRYMSSKQSNEMFQKKMKLHDFVVQILKERYATCGLYVVGSSMNTFGTNSSDMDMCLMLSENEIDQRFNAILILRDVLRIIKKFSFFVKAELIRAKVPILEFRDSVSEVEVDLNVNNSVGIRNTHLLHAYASLDWRVSPLVLIVKIWARTHDINDAKNMTISSYSLALMVIHFLQYGVTPPVLPCLQALYPEKFLPNLDVRTLKLEEKFQVPPTKNCMCLGQLLWLFFRYYATIFDFQNEAISIRCGRTLPKHHVKYQSAQKNTPSMWNYLCIEEPFDLSNTARSVYDLTVFLRIKSVFLTSYSKLNTRKNLNSILVQFK